MSGIVRPPIPTLGFRSGFYYSQEGGLGSDSGTISVAELALGIFRVNVAATFDRIGCYVTTAGTAGAVVRLGVYTSKNGMPDSLVLDAGTVDSTTTGVKVITISLPLRPAIYFVGGVAQVATCDVGKRAGPHPLIPENGPGQANYSCWTKGGVTGALPSTFVPDGPWVDLMKTHMRAV